MTAIQRFALHGTIMNPHSSGPYVRYEDHLAAMQGRCLAQIEEPAQPIAGYRISDPSDPELGFWFSETPCAEGYLSEPLYAGAAPAAVAGPALDVRAIAAAVCQRVAELPDRDSPEDWPEAMLVTGQELIDAVADEIEQALAQAAPALEAPAAPASVPGGWRLVPEKPTDAMLGAAQKAWLADPLRRSSTLYAAAQAAAPQAPAAMDELRQIADIAACWGCDHPDQPGDTELLRRIKWAARQLRAVAQAPAAPREFQQRVHPWLMECFGPAISADKQERNHRFLEEALETVQAGGCTASEAHQLVDYVFGRPVGELGQEVGGTMTTLAALCLANGIDMHAEAEKELARVWTMVEKIRAKQAAKPKHSPLPAAPAAPAVDAPLTDDEIEGEFNQAGGKWTGDYWKIEDADLHPYARRVEQRAVLAERERICAAIKSEDDHCATGDYMLDSDDCIKVVRGEWERPVYDAHPAAQAKEGGA